MNIAIVDDNPKRSSEIMRLLVEECNFNEEHIFQYYKTQDIKNTLRNMHFDIMFLDIVMPRRDETPNSRTSFTLLSDIDTNIHLKKPDTIIGITANVDDILEYKNEFEKRCLTVIEATNSNKDWKLKIIKAVNYKQGSSLNKGTNKSDIYCYTIHGIRTRGEWQQSLKRLTQQNIANVEFGTYKYGYFSLLAFFIPFFRTPVVDRFLLDLKDVLISNEDKKIILFSHSFGTYILIKALEKLVKKDEFKNISTIVLSGSVLNKKYNFKNILNKTDARIVNDCGSSDYILSLSEAFVPFAGMAGKVGFRGTNDRYFVNRYFEGSHSHYFDEESSFMRKYWLPLFSDDHEIELIDQRKDSFFRLGLLDKSTSFLCMIKEIAYIFIVLATIYYFIIN